MNRAVLLLIFLLLMPQSLALIAEAESIEAELTAFVQDEAEIHVIMGTHASTAERMLYYYVRTRDARVREIGTRGEDAVPPTGALMVIGGPTQNGVAVQYMNDPSYTGKRIDTEVGSILFLEGERKVLIFSDAAGFGNLPKRVEKSPLAKIFPKAVVPSVAAAVGLLLIWKWHLLTSLLIKIGRFKISDKIMKWVKRHEIHPHYVGFHVKGIRFKIREWIAIILAALVFGASLSYMYLAPGINIFLFILFTILVNSFVYGLRHLLRLILDRHYGLHTEYKIWPVGLLITALTGWLGNTFCLAGYIISNEQQHNKAGKIAYIVNGATLLIALVLWIWNFFAPTLLLQMTMLLCLAIGYLQLFPLTPFSGKSIYAWSKLLWWTTFIPATLLYVIANLLV